MGKTIIGYFLCLLILIVVIFGSYLWLPSSIHYHITERYSITSISDDAKVYFGVLIPISCPYQTVKDTNIVWAGEKDRLRQSCVDMHQLSGTINAGETQDAVFEYKLIVKHGLVLWRGPTEACHLEPQELIESDHPDIIDRAAQIASGNSIIDAYKIYSFTSDFFIHPNSAECYESYSALSAYQSRSGACGEYSRLMVALSRANGIPSRMISGILLPYLPFPGASISSLNDHPGSAHAWVEFNSWLGWSIADPALGTYSFNALQFARNDGRHVFFGGADLEGKVYKELWLWALRNGIVVDKKNDALKYVFSSESAQVLLTPEVTIRMGWDSRWLNTVIITAITTYFLCRFRNRRLERCPPSKAQ